MVTVEKTQEPQSEIRSFIGVSGVASAFAVTPRCIKNWINNGSFPKPYRIGRRILRWDVAALNDWIEAGCPRVQEK